MRKSPDDTPAERPLLIRADMREQGARVIPLLRAYEDVTLELSALPSADYVLSESVAVDRKEAGDFAASIMDRRLFAQEGLGYQVGLREPRPRGANLHAEYLVEGLPGVGRRRARELLRYFGTPAAVMRASVEELGRVPGIGPKSAQQIWGALNTEYVPDERES